MLIKTNTEAYENVPLNGVIIDANNDIMQLKDLTGFGELGYSGMDDMHTDPKLPARLIWPRRFDDEDLGNAAYAIALCLQNHHAPSPLRLAREALNALEAPHNDTPPADDLITEEERVKMLKITDDILAILKGQTR